MIAIYPGSFDPPTKAHSDIYWQAKRALGTVLPVVAANPGKDRGLLDRYQRQAAWDMITTDGSAITLPSEATIIDLAAQVDAQVIVRGLRGPEDFPAERAYREFIARNAPQLDVAYFFSALRHSDISSTAVRQILSLSGSDHLLSGYLDTAVIGYLRSCGLTKV